MPGDSGGVLSIRAVFVELATRTHFSFLRGGSPPQDLLSRAARLGYGALGVADCDGLYGIVRALEAAETVGLRLVVGCEVAIDRDAGDAWEGSEPWLWLHIATREGYSNLCRILTESHERHPKGQPRKLESRVARNQFAGLPIERVCANAGGLCAWRRRCKRRPASRR